MRPRLRPATALPPVLAGNLEWLRQRLMHGHGLDIDPFALVWERTEVLELPPVPSDQMSRSGVCRLLPTRDGWIALTLSRPWDLDALAAWMGYEWAGDPWAAAAGAAATMTAAEGVERAQLLGMAAARWADGFDDDQARSRDQDPPRRPWLSAAGGAAGGLPSRSRPLVADLSALWAGPLAGRILAEWGAEVVKVEDPGRPDGFRQGAPAFYERLNAAKTPVAASLVAAVGLMQEADIVITSARPRVWEHLAIPPLRGTWIRITGYGSTGPWRDRAAFGDDAAVAGGLVWPGEPPAFVGDAIADPLTGIAAAAAALWGHRSGGHRIIDVAMREVAGWLSQRPVASEAQWATSCSSAQATPPAR